MVRVHIFVEGHVQGVFYRASTRSQARALGVLGWVRNLNDGRVEAVAEGERKDVETLIDFMRTGPEYAQVTDLRLEYETPTYQFDSFS